MASVSIVKVNEYLKYIIKEDHRGKRITCFYRDTNIATKEQCPHTECLINFIAKTTIMVDQLERFGKALEPSENLN